MASLFLYLVVVLLVCVLVLWWRSSPFYWKRSGVPYLPAWPLLGSCSPTAIFRGQISLLEELYARAGRRPYVGFHLFNKPALLVGDPSLIETIFVRDSDHFNSRGIYTNASRDYVARNLFTLDGNPWRYTRAKLGPFFTPAKIRRMLHFAADSLGPLAKRLSSSKPIEVHALMTRFTTDVFTKSTFGIESDAYDKDSQFFHLQNAMFGNGLAMKVFTGLTSRRFYDWFRLKLMGDRVNDFMLHLTEQLLAQRKQSSDAVEKHDLLRSLAQLAESENNLSTKENKPIKFDTKMIAAQLLVLFAGGTESGGSTLSFALHELAVHQDMQDKAREEVEEILKGRLPDYDSLRQLKFINAIISETLRKYTPFSMLNRMCTKAYRIPGTDVVLEPGTIVIVPVYSIQNDPKNFPLPDIFRPERFLDEEAAGRTQGAYMPFGLGPRICLGMKFALVEMALVLTYLLQNFEFTMPTETPEEDRLRMPLRPYRFLSQPLNGVWLNVRPLRGEEVQAI